VDKNHSPAAKVNPFTHQLAVDGIKLKAVEFLLLLTTPNWNAKLREKDVRALKIVATNKLKMTQSSSWTLGDAIEPATIAERILENLLSLLVTYNAYAKQASDENLAKLHVPLLRLGEFLQNESKDFCAGLKLLAMSAKFLTLVAENNEREAIAVYADDDMIRALVRATPNKLGDITEPEDVDDAVQKALEKELDIAIRPFAESFKALQPGQLQQELAYLTSKAQLYESLLTAEHWKQVADQFRVMLQVLRYDRESPVATKSALQKIRSGRTTLSRIFQCPAGKMLGNIVEKHCQRNAADATADLLFCDAQSLMAPSRFRLTTDLFDNDFADVVQIVTATKEEKNIPWLIVFDSICQVGVKALSAVNSWSKLRLEEQAPSFRALVKKTVIALYMARLACECELVEICTTFVTSVHNVDDDVSSDHAHADVFSHDIRVFEKNMVGGRRQSQPGVSATSDFDGEVLPRLRHRGRGGDTDFANRESELAY